MPTITLQCCNNCLLPTVAISMHVLIFSRLQWASTQGYYQGQHPAAYSHVDQLHIKQAEATTSRCTPSCLGVWDMPINCCHRWAGHCMRARRHDDETFYLLLQSVAGELCVLSTTPLVVNAC